MIPDILGRYIGANAAIMQTFSSVRPITADRDDKFPYLLYEGSGFQRRDYVNGTSPWKEGTVRLHICTLDYDQAGVLAEMISDLLPGGPVPGDIYTIYRVRLDDESDIDQVVPQNTDAQYYVKVLDLWVRACKNP